VIYEFDDIVAEVSDWLQKESTEVLSEFLNTKEKDLISYHTSLGRKIRNEFKLWELNWTPEIVDGVDISQDHPDAISMRVIETIWNKFQQI
jgi:hypothetical protein